MANFAIDSVDIKNPSSFKIERFNVTNLERLASALMAGDLIAQKRKFHFTYESISAADLDVILGAIWSSAKVFFTLDYIENGVAKQATVYVGSIPSELHLGGTSNWIWKNVTFNLIEQ